MKHQLSQRVQEIEESITLTLNNDVQKMLESGRYIYNLTSGQLPFKPHSPFIASISTELNFLKSFQYPPSEGFRELRQKFLNDFMKSRQVESSGMDCTISNGSKQSLFNALATLVDPGDEVILLTPYWVSYPHMIRLLGGKVIEVQTSVYDSFIPDLNEVEKSIGPKTKAIIINSPNNPSGVHYDENWMKAMAKILVKNPSVYIISDEVYHKICYFDPKPVYFYQFEPSLLERTLVIDGISKFLASTGLRIGSCLGPNEIIQGMKRMQGQTTSGANSLIQRALIHYNFDLAQDYLKAIHEHIRSNAEVLMEVLEQENLSHLWYQCKSAFYFLLDFSSLPILEHCDDKKDYSSLVAKKLLEFEDVAVIPGGPSGIMNSLRLSLVEEQEPFEKGIRKLIEFLKKFKL